MKKIFIIFAFAAVIAACSNSQKNTSGKDSDGSDTIREPVMLTVNEFLENAGDYVGQEIKIQGTVSHTCKHGGKRMFIFDDSEDNRAKIEASETVASFDASLEGSDVLVSGLIKELVIDEAFLTEWEMEVNAEMNEPEGESDTAAVYEHEGAGLGEAADQGTHLPAMDNIAEYRKQIKESGTDHLSFYSVECLAYEVLPSDTLK